MQPRRRGRGRAHERDGLGDLVVQGALGGLLRARDLGAERGEIASFERVAGSRDDDVGFVVELLDALDERCRRKLQIAHAA